jgi:ectoine hydroxylase-related dioxygenase (phytanoyl-CoA dioxygenase family)
MKGEDPIAEIRDMGFCILRDHFDKTLIHRCRDAFWPILLKYVERNRDHPNRGDRRHFLPMPFDAPCFAPQFFFDPEVLRVVRGVMDDRAVADQWGCDAPLKGSIHQQFHVDYQRPLFAEAPDMLLPTYMLVVSFGLIDIEREHGPIEIAPGTHKMARSEALRTVENGGIEIQPITLGVGDVLIRHPWALHRGTPNLTDTPRALLTIRYVRRWFFDNSRDVRAIPRAVWESLTAEEKSLLRYPVEER